MQGSDGNLYGGTNAGGNGGGEVYKLTLDGTFKVLQNFCYRFSDTCFTGAYPTRLVQDDRGNFFGTAANGGSYNSGTVFEITSTSKFVGLHRFTFGGRVAASWGLTLAVTAIYMGSGQTTTTSPARSVTMCPIFTGSFSGLLQRASSRRWPVSITVRADRFFKAPTAISTGLPLRAAQAIVVTARHGIQALDRFQPAGQNRSDGRQSWETSPHPRQWPDRNEQRHV